MADPYEEEFYGDEVYYEPAPQRGMSGWLIALIVVLVVLLFCCVCACAALVLASPVIGNTLSTIIETLTPMP